MALQPALFVSLFLPALLSRPVSSLPRSCSMELLRVNCRHAGLDSVPELPPNATAVDLSYNNITELNHSQFNNLPDLNQLTASFNQISSIEDGTFSSLGKLTSLVLSNNSLTAVTRPTFEGLAISLNMLSLDSNPDLDISEGALQSLTSLYTLLVEGFTGAGSYNFSNMASLAFLAAPECGIRSLDPENFLGLLSLSDLDLAGNSLDRFPSELVDQLPALTDLNLEYNNITKTDGTLVGGPNSSIITLNLDYNKLVELHSETFDGMVSLETLTLTNNKMRFVPNGTLDFPDGHAIEVTLAGNPLSCDCDLRWVATWLESPNRHIDDVACAFPMYLYGERVADLTPDKYVCTPESVSGAVHYNVTVGGNVTLANPFPYDRYTGVKWYATCGPLRSEVKAGGTYSFGADSSLVITGVAASLCLYYEGEATNLAGKGIANVILQLSGEEQGPNIVVLALSVAVGVVGFIAIIAVACHFSRIRKYGRAMRMMRYDNLTENSDA